MYIYVCTVLDIKYIFTMEHSKNLGAGGKLRCVRIPNIDHEKSNAHKNNFRVWCKRQGGSGALVGVGYPQQGEVIYQWHYLELLVHGDNNNHMTLVSFLLFLNSFQTTYALPWPLISRMQNILLLQPLTPILVCHCFTEAVEIPSYYISEPFLSLSKRK